MSTKNLKEKIEEVLEKEIRPHLLADGGDIELVKIKGDSATFRLKGACVGCPFRSQTMSYGIERKIKEEVPEIKKVLFE